MYNNQFHEKIFLRTSLHPYLERTEKERQKNLYKIFLKFTKAKDICIINIHEPTKKIV